MGAAAMSVADPIMAPSVLETGIVHATPVSAPGAAPMGAMGGTIDCTIWVGWHVSCVGAIAVEQMTGAAVPGATWAWGMG